MTLLNYELHQNGWLGLSPIVSGHAGGRGPATLVSTNGGKRAA
jgi:hypothetical protein